MGLRRKISVLVCLSVTLCLLLVYYNSTLHQFDVKPTVLADIVDDSFFVKTPGCRIPRLDPFDASILAFLNGPKLNCTSGGKGGAPLVTVQGETLHVLQSGLQYYNITSADTRGAKSKFYCEWQEFHRKTPDPTKIDVKIDDSAVYGQKSEPFTVSTPTKPGTEFLRAQCFLNKKLIYRDFFFIPSGNPTLLINNSTGAAPNARPKHSVLLFALDSVSRLNFFREMPLLHHFLTHELGAIDFEGYHKVGHNTLPNLIPLLTGFSEEEFGPVCWPNKTSFFDACPFIWKAYHSRGYVTSLVEDHTDISAFNWLKSGNNTEINKR